MTIPQPANPVTRARRAFFDDGITPRGLIPETIIASWQRCRTLGLEAGRAPNPDNIDITRLLEARDCYERLRRVSRPELESLYASASRSGSIVILTAPDGLILDAVGNPEFLNKAARVALCPGASWNEPASGTNAIGTALVEQRAIEVHGAEHYYFPHRILNCSASPVFNPCGSIAGVLDLSGDARTYHAFALDLVRAAAERIEARLFELEFSAAEIIRIDLSPDIVRTNQTGLIVLRGSRIHAANRRALALLDLPIQALGRQYDDLFASALPSRGRIGAISCRDGRTLYVRWDGSRTQVQTFHRTRRAALPVPHRAVQPFFIPTLKAQIERAATLLNAGLPVLLQGETGTGKELVARELHARCAPDGAPFVSVHCVALPEGLIESELFGYAPGAFNGARHEGYAGLLHQANGGTLLLDEVGDMSPALQSRLLRVLQERESSPLGCYKPEALNFRLISATQHPLARRVEDGGFRHDLYYRIAQANVFLPALRDYPDPAALIGVLWTMLGGDTHQIRLDASLIATLAARPWPGNLRQLVSVLRGLMALGNPGALLTVADLPSQLLDTASESAPRMHVPGLSVSHGNDMQRIQLRAIQTALVRTHGNVAAAARHLGISRGTLYRHLKSGARHT